MKSSFTLRIKRKNIYQLLLIYGCLLFYVVFLTPNRYKRSQYKTNLIPIYQTIEKIHKPEGEPFWLYYIYYWGNIFGNVILFVPLGILLKCLAPNKTDKTILLYGLLTSASIELVQLLLQIGVCDIDDVILNITGVVLGIIIYQKKNTNRLVKKYIE